MFGIGFLVLAAGFVIAIIALHRTSKLDAQIAQLKLQLGQLSQELAKLKPGVAIKPIAPEPVVEKPVQTAEPAKVWPAKAAAVPISKTEVVEPKLPKRDMEQAVASRWFVWIGGVAMAIGGLLFVKYAYDEGLISPRLQIFLGLILAAALVFAGDWLKRKTPETAESNYVPAALSAAGLATGFASIYAAYALYELVQSTTAFIGLGLVGLVALGLSLRQGPLIAALGLLGSYVTPMIISSLDPSGWGFFPYLLIILAACFAVLRQRPWWWLGYAAIAGSAIWSLLWFEGPFEAVDTLPLGLFALCVGAISIFAVKGRAILGSDMGSLLNPIGMAEQLKLGSAGVLAGSLILAALVFQSDHAPLSLMLFFLGLVAVAALSWFKQGDTVAAPAAGILALVVLMGWENASFIDWAMDERGMWVSLLGGEAPQFLNWMLFAGLAFTALGIAGVFKKTPSVTWAALVAGAAVLFIFGAWAKVEGLLPDNMWALFGSAAAAVLAATVWLRREHDNVSNGLLSAGAAALLLFAEDRMLEGVWLTLAIAILATVYACSTRLLPVRLLGPISAALASLTAIRLFVSRELWNDDRTHLLGPHWPLYGYGVPVVLFYVGANWLKSAGHFKSATALEGISLGLAISLVSLELRVLIGGGVTSDEPQLLEMSAHILTWLGAAYGLIYRQQIFSSFISLWGARVLVAASCVAIIFLSLGALSPIVTEDPVPGNVIFNALLLAYAGPVILLGLIARRADALGWAKIRPALGLLALVLALAYVTLETKRVFQGPAMVAWPLTAAEAYAYSAVWLLSAFALFVAGIKLARQYIRYAGLGVMALVVVKVFVSDMSDLEGLYRILSFMGLGICLVGMGWLYTRFVQPRLGETANVQ